MADPTLPDDLLAVLAELRQPTQIQSVFTDLLTPAEVQAIAERWAIVKLLAEGHSQRAVRDAVGCSVTTVTRGNRHLQYGSGGFHLAFDALSRLGLPDPRRRGES
ncbi:MAG: hypothetical protein EA397_13675 [Deltaproteobacteria bacterium]|nr:MAG: hypothetical protein EA397_13675 [Deltaproteobacteria bacterium]